MRPDHDTWVDEIIEVQDPDMIRCLIWRQDKPGIVTYYGTDEIDFIPCDDEHSALALLAKLKG